MNTTEAKIEKTEWMPIESAPKDGTDLLLWDPSEGVVLIGYYSVARRDWRAEIRDEPRTIRPAHWQPLPQPPEHPKTLQFVQNVRNLISEQTGLKNDL